MLEAATLALAIAASDVDMQCKIEGLAPIAAKVVGGVGFLDWTGDGLKPAAYHDTVPEAPDLVDLVLEYGDEARTVARLVWEPESGRAIFRVVQAGGVRIDRRGRCAAR